MLAEASMVPIEVSCLDHFLQDEGSRRAGGRVAEIERSRGMRCWFARNGVGALCLTPAEGKILAGGFVERDHQIVRRHVGRRGDAGVDVFQEREPRLLGTPFDESEIEDDQVVGIMHADKRWRVEEALLRKFKDELIEVFGRYPKRVHQGS